jgi:4-hydroxy-3-methylbut-2-en-1-yl diphosphate synthase IspG/GcpE
MTQNKSQEPVSDDIASILACRDMLDAQPVPTRRTEQNFCPRCGKRTKDLTTIHTCTPPQD